MSYEYCHENSSKMNDTLIIATHGGTTSNIPNAFTAETRQDSRYKLTYYENQIRYIDLNCHTESDAVTDAISYLCLRARIGCRYPAKLIRIHGSNGTLTEQIKNLIQAGYTIETE